MIRTSDAPAPWQSYASHLECTRTGERYQSDRQHGLSAAGKPLFVRYDLPALARALDRDRLTSRPPDIWCYREFLPVREPENVASLGEGTTPLLSVPALRARVGGGPVYIKDEGRLPTGSFKARGLCLAVSMAKAFGIERMAMPSNGNAGSALAAYCSRVGIESVVFCPADTPTVNLGEMALQGARVYRVDGQIDDCAKIVADGRDTAGWFDASTLKEPYRIEGKKTMGFELAEQFGWELPDVIFYPTGGGTGLIGMWKAFEELAAVGWIGPKRPRMIAVQAAGCAPIVRAYEAGAVEARRWTDARTLAAGIRVPATIGDFLILQAVRDSDGFAIAVSDSSIQAARAEVAAAEGILLCPEGAATWAAYRVALDSGRVGRDETAVLFNCASGLKYKMPRRARRLQKQEPIDYAALAGPE